MKYSKLNLVMSLLAVSASQAAEISKANNTDALNLGTSWVGGAVPGAVDVAFYNNTVTAANTSLIGGNLAVGGIRVTNPTGSVILAATAGAGLTIGTSGINMATATSALMYEGPLLLSGNQTWSVANASTTAAPFAGTNRQFNNNEDLALHAGNTTGTGIAFNLGGNTVGTTGAGTISISSGYAMSNGTINVGNTLFQIQGGASKATTLGSDLTVNVATGAKFMVQSNSGALTSAASVKLNGGTFQFTANNATNAVTQSGSVQVNAASTILVANNIGGGGLTGPLIVSGNLTGSANLALNNTATAAAVLQLAGDNSGYTGAVTMGGSTGKNFRMTTSTAGSAAAVWTINAGLTLQLAGVNVTLGTLNGAGTVNNSTASTTATAEVSSGTFSGVLADGAGLLALRKSGPGTLTLTGGNTYTGPTTVAQGILAATAAQTGATAVTVADGATFSVKILSAGTTLTIPSLNTGATSGAVVQLETGTLGNPAAAPLQAGAFTVTAPTKIRVSGSALQPGTAIPLVGYTSLGGLGFAGLSLELPPRTNGVLANNTAASQLEMTISNIDVPRWEGSVSGGDWDVDDGSGIGTLNWKEVVSGNVTRYLQGAGGTDAALFNDSATGTTNVNLTTTLTPQGTTVDCSAKHYTFGGAGKLSGTGALIKNGTGVLTLANTGGNDYTGVTLINSGTVQVGDGTTLGGGQLGSAAVTNEGTLELNRPDDFPIANAITGAGTLKKNQASVVTLSAVAASTGPTILAGGKLKFTGGGALSGAISGTGELESGGGIMQINGLDANTNTNLTTVSAGTLQLNKTGASAVGGDVTISGSGVLVVLANEQIPDTATLSVLGTSADSMVGSTGSETIANVIVNPSVTTGQLVMRNNFTVTNQATLNKGVLGAASGHVVNLRKLTMTGGTLRVAGSAAASTMNIGDGGITTSGGVIEVKFNTNDQDATLNLGGTFTATANISINNGGYAGTNLNVINLTGAGIFDIASGTTTTVNPDITSVGGLTKIGAGNLLLNPACAGSYTGLTQITAGQLTVLGTLSGSDLAVSGTLAGTGAITTGAAGVDVNLGGKISPGNAGVGTLRVTMPGGTLDMVDAVTPAASGSFLFDLDTPATSDLITVPEGTLAVGDGVLEIDDFVFNPTANFAAGTYPLITTELPITGTLGSNLTTTLNGLTVRLTLADSNTDLVLIVSSGSALQGWRQTYFGTSDNAGVAANTADPDHDDVPNLIEYLLGTLPNASNTSPAVTTSLQAGQLTLTYTRLKAALTDVDAQVETSPNLTDWTTNNVTETVVSEDATTQLIQASVPYSSGTRFLRLRATEK